MELARQNGLLLERIRDLDRQVETLQAAAVGYNADSKHDTATVCPDTDYRYIMAKIVSATVNRRLNYITINKGRRDGIENDMGVVCPDGIVGTVALASEKFSLVLPVINLQSMTSCRLDSCKNFGSLQWDGADPGKAKLKEIPRHAAVAEGEKVVTSGFSDIFPEGVPVGYVESMSLGDADNFYDINVRLSTDFGTIRYVYVVAFADNAELRHITDSINTLNGAAK